jgi:hypothetical protein
VPSPQPVTNVQWLLQVSQSSVLPSSHSSPGSTMPSPQRGMRVHCGLQRSGTGGSHSSPHAPLIWPSPQRSPV